MRDVTKQGCSNSYDQSRTVGLEMGEACPWKANQRRQGRGRMVHLEIRAGRRTGRWQIQNVATWAHGGRVNTVHITLRYIQSFAGSLVTTEGD